MAKHRKPEQKGQWREGRLPLRKETLRPLTIGQLGGVAGGIDLNTTSATTVLRNHAQ